jgi:hypothetical protein
MNPYPDCTHPAPRFAGAWQASDSAQGALTEGDLREGAGRLPDLLARNVALPPDSKYVLGAGGQLVVRVESRREDPLGHSPYGGHEAPMASPGVPAHPATAASDGAGQALAARLDIIATACAEAGQTVTRGPGDSLRVELDGAPELGPVCVTADAYPGARFRVSLITCPALSEASTLAWAVLGLLGGGAVRLVRAATIQQEAQTVLLLEACVGARPEPAEVLDALDALALGARLMAAEARALLDPGPARIYLEMVREAMGFPPAGCPSVNLNPNQERKAA